MSEETRTIRFPLEDSLEVLEKGHKYLNTISEIIKEKGKKLEGFVIIGLYKNPEDVVRLISGSNLTEKKDFIEMIETYLDHLKNKTGDYNVIDYPTDSV